MAAADGDVQASYIGGTKRLNNRSHPPRVGWLAPDHEAPKAGYAYLQSSINPIVSVAGGKKEHAISYVAVAPRIGTLCPTESTPWYLLAVQTGSKDDKDNEPDEPLVRIHPSSNIIRAVQRSLHEVIESKAPRSVRHKIPIHIRNVQPLALTRVVIEVDVDALRKHDEVQAKFAGGFLKPEANGVQLRRKDKGKGFAQDEYPATATFGKGLGQDSRIANAIKDALASSCLIHKGDLIALPLPTHPITHAAFPPARVVDCQPVHQGLIRPRTSVVVRSASKNHLGTTSANGLSPELNRSVCSSDESSDGPISIEPPQLPYTSILSPGGFNTPRPFECQFNAPITPGSVLSTYSATTTGEGPIRKGRTLNALGLLSRIPDNSLTPTPAPDEDDEARVFVDMGVLVKLRCFSGDWISVEPAVEIPGGQETSIAVEGPAKDGLGKGKCRPVKIYGLSSLALDGQTKTKPKFTQTNKITENVSYMGRNVGLETWMSPILLANLGNPKVVRFCKMPDLSNKGQKPEESMLNVERLSTRPPTTDEVTLNRISSPLSSNKILQGALLFRLKSYFEHKLRIHKEGDLIALDIDTDVGILWGAADDDPGSPQDIDKAMTFKDNTKTHSGVTGVAWFRISRLHVEASSTGFDLSGNLDWYGAACVEPTNTPIGVEQSMIPPTVESTWEYYLGCKSSPDIPKNRSIIPTALSKLPSSGVLPTLRRLKELIAAAVSSHAIHLNMDPTILLLHSTQRNIGKSRLAVDAASALGLHIFTIDAYDLLAEGGPTEVDLTFRARVGRALSCGAAFTVLHVRHIEALTSGRMSTVLREAFSSFRAVICTATEVDSIPETARTFFTHEIEVHAPNENERRLLLQTIITERSLRIAQDVSISSLALKTAALVAGNLVDIVDRAVVARQNRLANIIAENRILSSEFPQPTTNDLLLSTKSSDILITNADFITAIDAARASFSDSIGAPKIPSVSWADVGGLASVKDAVMETIQLPLARPELFAKGMKKRSGILFYGPPGTGKTLLAKAIATEFSLNFFSVKGPELLNMYIGESEANVRRVFQRARDARPCVVFFDELDSVAPKRGNQGDSGGVMDRIVSQLLAELDGMSDSSSSSSSEGGAPSNGGVFVIGATNRPDLLDQALLRPGRFDKLLYLGISDTHEKQHTILKALTRKFQLHPDCDLARVAEKLAFTYTGADLYALCSDAMLKAVMRSAGIIDRKAEAQNCTVPQFFDLHATKKDLGILVEEQDFERAGRELVGSVSARELDHYQRVRERFERPEEKATVNGSLHEDKGKGKARELNRGLRVQQDHVEQRTSLLKATRRPKPAGRVETAIKSPIGWGSTKIPQPESLGKDKHTTGNGSVTEKQWRDNGSDDDDDDADVEDEGFVTSNDYGTPEQRRGVVKGPVDFGHGDKNEGMYQ